MVGKACVFELDRGLKVPKNKAVDSAIESAIKAEEKEEMVYAQAATRSTNYRVKELLTWLATEENKHARALSGLKSCLQSQGRWDNHAKSLGSGPALTRIPSDERQRVSKDELRVLLEAMKAEKKSIAHYAKLAAKAKSPDSKKFFEGLAEYEREHYEKLDELFEELSKLELP